MDKFVVFVEKILFIIVLEVFYSTTYSAGGGGGGAKVSQMKIIE